MSESLSLTARLIRTCVCIPSGCTGHHLAESTRSQHAQSSTLTKLRTSKITSCSSPETHKN